MDFDIMFTILAKYQFFSAPTYQTGPKGFTFVVYGVLVCLDGRTKDCKMYLHLNCTYWIGGFRGHFASVKRQSQVYQIKYISYTHLCHFSETADEFKSENTVGYNNCMSWTSFTIKNKITERELIGYDGAAQIW